MACAEGHVKDSAWDIDLIWEFLHETATSGKKVGSWYNVMDPKSELNDRHEVYKFIVGDATSKFSGSSVSIESDMTPWNQKNKGIVKVFNTDRACGSVVKISFIKYMNWPAGEPPRQAVKSFSRTTATTWIERSLSAKQPIRAQIPLAHHYVGIVGFKKQAPGKGKLLIIDPWYGGYATGGNVTKYGGGESPFLGIGTADGNDIIYDGQPVTSLEGYHPF
jgi:hypothetical protein